LKLKIDENPMLQIVRGNIVELIVDVIVNSAHPSLMAGGGVCGAIHSAAGPLLEKEAKPLGPLDSGCAVTTSGFNLKATKVIHAVAPRRLRVTEEEEMLLERTYEAAIIEFHKLSEVKSIAFPSMGTGI
jgi:O-acetyl-ADP-ribose deacetylase (regulator of RNase III)